MDRSGHLYPFWYETPGLTAEDSASDVSHLSGRDFASLFLFTEGRF